MISTDITALRLQNQQIAGPRFTAPEEVVSWLGAVQAQEYHWAKWAIGLRLATATDTTIEQAIAAKKIIRTWPMRGTLHFIAADDVRWWLALLAPRVLARSNGRHRQLALDEAIFARAQTILADALQGGQALTRPEIMALLERHGIATDGQRGYHILWQAAQTGLICFGVMEGKQPTFVLLDEWAPPGKSLTGEAALAELARRYFRGHGPATVQDLVWWSGLTLTEARAALEMVRPELRQERMDDQTYWLAADVPAFEQTAPAAYLLAAFDEYLLGYKDRRAALDPAPAAAVAPGGNGVFMPLIVVNGRVAGIWKRAIKKETVTITLHPFAPFSPAEEEAVAHAAGRYGAFVGKRVVL